MRKEEVKQHLAQDIIPFWKKMRDEEYGGFYGEMDFNLKINKKADKGGILNSRILWFFSNAYKVLGDEECLSCAGQAYRFLKSSFYDKENGGVFWSVTYDGKPADDTKHTYNQAFAIYALSSYYSVSKDSEALKLAYELMEKVESCCRDEGGYLEAFDRRFGPADNEKLSENGVLAERTMNSLLHVFEAYTELYRVDKDREVAGRLARMLDIFADKIYNPQKRQLDVFFDSGYNSLIDLNSYGHDIETAWLIDRGVEVLGNPDYEKKIYPITAELAEHIHSVALDINGDEISVYNECEKGIVDTKKVWWVQAEAVLGFLNAYRKSPLRTDYLESAGRIWDYIKDHMIDKREGSEWFNELDKGGNPIKTKEIAGLWKCPYHNGRMCFEVINSNIEF